jgi:Domain of unknown function (DUF4192)
VCSSGHRTAMTSATPELLTIGSPNDLLCAAIWQLGFMPADSVMVICLHGRRGRFGLVMRFDLDYPDGEVRLAEEIAMRVASDGADSVVIAIFSTDSVEGFRLPLEPLVDDIADTVDADVVAAYFVREDRWWSYFCTADCCYLPEGTVLDFASPTATNVGAAFALAGHSMLADRDAVFRSVQCDLPDAAQARIAGRILAARSRHRKRALTSLQLTMRRLAGKLVAARIKDPRAAISDRDAVELAALSFEPVVRDEVLVLAVEQSARKALLAVLREIVRRTPPLFDAPVCSMLAWVSYVDGDGVVASICVDRALSTDPDYSLAHLISDSLYHQIPPGDLEEVMQGAARDLRRGHTAG